MAAGPLSIKLRCASWQQLSTIYKRDLSKGTMFLKAASPPPLGTAVRIDLTLPSASVIVLNGVVEQHVTDPQRGSGVELKLAPIPAGSVWMIESALASESKRRNTAAGGIPVISAPGASGPTGHTMAIPTVGEGEDVVAAEQELVKALQSEAESLKKLNPFLVLGVGYEATDADVRAAFGELTKRYHPDLFARYQSQELRSVAAEIFILIRDAYRKLGDEAGRQQALSALGRAAAPRPVPLRAPTPPPVPVAPPRKPTGAVPIVTPPPVARPFTDVAETVRPGDAPAIGSSPSTTDSPPQRTTGRIATPPRGVPNVTTPLPPSGPPVAPQARPVPATTKSPALAPTQRAETSQPLPPVGRSEGSGGLPPARESQPIPSITKPASRAPTTPPPPPPQARRAPTADPSAPLPRETTPPPPVHTDRRPMTSAPPPIIQGADGDTNQLDELLDAGKFDEALAAYKLLAKKNPSDRTYRAGIELCEGLRSLSQRDRLEAAQRFEAALEIDPSNERAARELAEMRRQATNERKGLLTRLMGKKEP